MTSPVENTYGIPTLYNGYVFRSRLEAKWAAFFDLLRWRYEYEPCEFNGWIPDFVIFGDRPIYVEVKPVVSFPEEVAQKIDASGCKEEVLIVGLAPFPGEYGDLCIGWLTEGNDEDSWGMDWAQAPFGKWKGEESSKKGDGRIGFCHAVGSYRDRITGAYDGGSFGSGRLYDGEVIALWHKAANVTQWRGRQP